MDVHTLPGLHISVDLVIRLESWVNDGQDRPMGEWEWPRAAPSSSSKAHKAVNHWLLLVPFRWLLGFLSELALGRGSDRQKGYVPTLQRLQTKASQITGSRIVKSSLAPSPGSIPLTSPVPLILSVWKDNTCLWGSQHRLNELNLCAESILPAWCIANAQPVNATAWSAITSHPRVPFCSPECLQMFWNQSRGRIFTEQWLMAQPCTATMYTCLSHMSSYLWKLDISSAMFC